MLSYEKLDVYQAAVEFLTLTAELNTAQSKKTGGLPDQLRCAALSIPGRLRHAEYLGSWLRLLKEDKKAIFTAAAKATEASQYLERLGAVSGSMDDGGAEEEGV